MMQDQKPENDPDLTGDDDFDDDFLDADFGEEFDEELEGDLAEYDALDDEAITDMADDPYAEPAAPAATAPAYNDPAPIPVDEDADEDVGTYMDDTDFADDDWEDDEDYDDDLVGAGAQKEKKGGLGLSFNTIVISIAVVVGFCVLGYQVVTKKPQIVESFTTALKMTGATSGPIFGKTDPALEDAHSPTPVDEPPVSTDSGFLNDPNMLDQPDAANIDDAPPMPSPISSPEGMSPEEQAGMAEPANPVLTPMPDVSAMDQTGDTLVPRSPDDLPPAPNYAIDARTDASDVTPDLAPAGPDAVVATTEGDGQNRAEDMLKNALAAREQKKAQEALETSAAEEEIPTLTQPAEPPAPAEVADVSPPAPAPVVEETPNAQAQELAQAQAVAMNGAIEQKLDTLLDRLGGMETRIEDINKNSDAKIAALREDITKTNDEKMASLRDDIKNEIAALKADIQKAPAAPIAAAPSGASEEELAALRREFEQQIEQVKKEAAASAAAAAKKDATSAPVKEATAPSAVKEEPAPVKKQPAAAPAQPAPVKQAAAPAQSSGGAWELKAAKPGKAWVSRVGDMNIRGVGVGDTLEGLGRITAISFNGGRWVVQASGGQIRQ